MVNIVDVTPAISDFVLQVYKRNSFTVNYTMVSPHICDASCMDKIKLRNSSLVKCFGCDHSFNTKCFEKLPSFGKSTLASESNFIFLCGKCHTHLSKYRASARKSLSHTISSNVTTTNIIRTSDSIPTSMPQQILNSSVLPESNQSNAELLRSILSHVTRLSSMLEHQEESSLTSSSAAHIDDSSVFDMYRKFEKMSWDSIDILNKKIDAIQAINNTNSSLQESIDSNLDALKHQINSIDSAIANLQEKLIEYGNVNEKASQSENSTDQTTQQLHERFMNLFSDMDEIPTSAMPVVSSNVNTTVNTDAVLHRNDKLEFYVTKFSTNTTPVMLQDYMRDKGVTNFDTTRIRCLIPRNKNISTFTFVSFKIDTDAEVAKVITKPGFWPNNCKIKNFIHKSAVDLSQGNKSTNFLSHPSVGRTPT